MYVCILYVTLQSCYTYANEVKTLFKEMNLITCVDYVLGVGINLYQR